MKTFQPKLFSTLKNQKPSSIAADIVAGIIVAIIALPLSIALAIASGVSPEQGLYTAVIAGFVIAFFGGSRVNISGPTAAFATIVAGVVATNGISGLVIATILAGLFLIIMGICRLGSLIKYIPVTITTGFTSGIAITIIVGQLKDFFGLTFAPGTAAVETVEKVEAVAKSFGTVNLHAVIVGLSGLAILILWPMLGKLKLGAFSKIASKLPPSIIAVLFGILIVKFTPLEVNTIGTLYPDLPTGLPKPSIPEFSFDTVRAVIPDAFTIAILAAIESLLSCVVSDSMIGDKHNSNTELIALGAGNICSGIFGGIPATGAIARTAANVKNGGRSPIAGIVHALVLMLCLLLLMPYAMLIPMPIIAAILFMVAYNMSEWRHFVSICRHSPAADVLVLVATFLLTVIFDLVVAIAVGLCMTALLFIKKISDATYVRRWTEKDNLHEKNGLTVPEGVSVYEVNGPMFFADSEKFADILPDEGTRVLILRMSGVPTIDATALGSFEKLHALCCEREVRLILSHVNPQPMRTLKHAGTHKLLGEESFAKNIEEALEMAGKFVEK